jgi:hypothetical protein
MPDCAGLALAAEVVDLGPYAGQQKLRPPSGTPARCNIRISRSWAELRSASAIAEAASALNTLDSAALPTIFFAREEHSRSRHGRIASIA